MKQRFTVCTFLSVLFQAALLLDILQLLTGFLGVLLIPTPVNSDKDRYLLRLCTDFVLFLRASCNSFMFYWLSKYYPFMLTQHIFAKVEFWLVSKVSYNILKCYETCSCHFMVSSVFVVKWISVFKDILFCYHLFIVLSECHCSTFCMNKVSYLLSAERYQFSTSNPQCYSSMHPMQAMRVEFSLDEECYHAYSSNSLNSQWIDFVLLLLVQGLVFVLKWTFALLFI